ncbi:hypothetical protein L1N85_15015 [Paenibacillus alkaliterrae]|uniref:hypothetical protein n=1 Tax=Paenibacillus alkaliterrae TaxID=320909 RepID=UPI001F429E09|nr:hypothetical protein [Paenibacillus alkaliterrae]MCF2939730.1 hypothetical protein [Paenibacillus alkaliterrae]
MVSLIALQQHIDRICRFHPWYGVLLKKKGIHPPYRTELTELPFLTADILDAFYFTPEPRTEAGLSVYKTSGTSSGIRKAIYYSGEDDECYIASKTACFREWLESGKYPVKKALADMGTGHAAGTAQTIFERLGLQAESLSFALPVSEHVRRLSSFQPELLYTMPSILDAIVAAEPEPRKFGIRKIILVGEIATPQWQANVAERFGIGPDDILDTYGSIEIGAIASYSHELGLYVLAEGIHGEAVPAEQIDPRFEPLQRNEAVLVLTSYVRTLFPAMRYVTYDVVRGFQTIEVGGRQRQCFSCLSKRIGNELKHGEKISLYDIESVVHQFVKDAELRVRLRDNKLSVHIRSKWLEDSMLVHIQHAIEHKIAEIGQMIQNRMLAGIVVTRAAENEQLERGAVKSKKLYF